MHVISCFIIVEQDYITFDCCCYSCEMYANVFLGIFFFLCNRHLVKYVSQKSHTTNYHFGVFTQGVYFLVGTSHKIKNLTFSEIIF